jgi:hypothetical protein
VHYRYFDLMVHDRTLQYIQYLFDLHIDLENKNRCPIIYSIFLLNEYCLMQNRN